MKKLSFLAALLLLPHFVGTVVWADEEPFHYRSLKEIGALLNSVAARHADSARLRVLGQTPAGEDLRLLELGLQDPEAPAILVVANMEGNCPIATEAALELTDLLLGDWKDELTKRRWFILPVGNPDGYSAYFLRPLTADFGNARPFNDDNDDATDEDGPEDLNGDGYITMIRQLHPEGKWMKVDGNPVLMKKADTGKGEKGLYRLFTEGVDNDGDGKINEDGPGGMIPGRNFPHNFQHYTKTGGRWAASEPETRALLEFAFDHPQIEMVLTFGRTNSLKDVPESSKKTEAAQDKYKLPKRFAERMGVDPEKEFPLKELVDMARDFTGYMELTEEMVLMFLGVGAAANPDRNDLPYWKEISKRYNDFLKEAGCDEKRLKPAKFPPGSVEEWAYYQYGVPSFSMDFWTLPEKKKEEKKGEGEGKDVEALTPDKIEKMTNEEFIALGKEKIDAFLKANKGPGGFTAEMVIGALESGMMNTKKMAEFIRKAKKKEESGGVDETEEALYAFDKDAFVLWQDYSHPTLGEVQIGGQIPYSDLTPPARMVPELLEKQLPFVRKLAGLLPDVVIEKVEVQRKSSDVWRLNAWVANRGFLPYPTHQGKRCKRPSPVTVTLKGESATLLEGRARVVVDLLEGSGGVEKVSWVLQAKEDARVTLETHSFSAGRDKKIVTLNEGEDR